MSNEPTIVDAAGTSGDIPNRVGPYRVLRMLGRGGMGSVYLATRDDDTFKRRVAIKVIRKGMDTEDALKRFAIERQVVTALKHPNIAQVLDAGETEDGRPYVVMEYIEGQPLDLFCDKQRLNTEERLKLFMKVCAAVHTAHQNGVVHRDLKPSNILVTLEGEPKLLDFGIAKLVNPEMAVVTVVTGPEMRVMTPEYASPEQCSGDSITTASDVYSLGVMLYEVLTGKRPYTFKTRVREEVLRVVQEEEPSAPSTAITRAEHVVADDGTTKTLSPEQLAKSRDETVGRLQRRLRGDLDNIVLTAMQKLPRRRYASASALAADIANHLNGAPVVARGDSFVYVLSRFALRHRGKVAALSLGALLAVLAGGSLLWQQGKVREREIKLAAVREIAAKTLGELVEGMGRREGGLETRRVLASASKTFLDSLQSTFPGDPVLDVQRARALRAIADVQGGLGQNLGQTDEALQNYQAALELVTEDGAAPSVASGMTVLERVVLQAELRVAIGHVQLKANQTQAAKAAGDAALAGLKHPDSSIANAPSVLAVKAQALLLLSDLADDAASATELRNASLIIRRELSAKHPGDLENARSLSVMLVRLGEEQEWAEPADLQAALRYYQEALQLRENIVAISPNATSKRDIAMSKKFVGEVLLQLKRTDEAQIQIIDAQRIVQALRDATPTDARLASDAAELLRSLAWITSEKGDAETQEVHLVSAAKALQQLAFADPANLSLRGRAIDTYRELAELHWQAKRKEKAHEAIAMARDLASQGPTNQMQDILKTLDATLAEWK